MSDESKRFQLSVFDTQENEVLLDQECLGYYVTAINVTKLPGDDANDEGISYIQSFGDAFAPEELALIMFDIIEQFPETRAILDDMMSGENSQVVYLDDEENSD